MVSRGWQYRLERTGAVIIIKGIMQINCDNILKQNSALTGLSIAMIIIGLAGYVLEFPLITLLCLGGTGFILAGSCLETNKIIRNWPDSLDSSNQITMKCKDSSNGSIFYVESIDEESGDKQ